MCAIECNTNLFRIFALSRMVKSQTAMFYLRSPVSNYKIEHDKDVIMIDGLLAKPVLNSLVTQSKRL